MMRISLELSGYTAKMLVKSGVIIGLLSSVLLDIYHKINQISL
jgi:hypothetical protein